MMLIENMATREKWDRVVLHLAKSEAAELRDALQTRLDSDPGRHEHVPDASYTKEITVVLAE